MTTDKPKSKSDEKSWRYLVNVIFVTGLIIAAGLVGTYFLVDYMFRDTTTVQYGLASAPDAPPERDAQNTVTVYFTAENRRLHAQQFNFPQQRTEYETAKFILDELTQGPSSGYLLSPLPAGAHVKGIYFHGSDIVIDFSSDFPSLFSGGTGDELLGLYAIVNSLLKNLDSYSQVRFLVNGEEFAATDGGLDISQPFRENLNLLKGDKT